MSPRSSLIVTDARLDCGRAGHEADDDLCHHSSGVDEDSCGVSVPWCPSSQLPSLAAVRCEKGRRGRLSRTEHNSSVACVPERSRDQPPGAPGRCHSSSGGGSSRGRRSQTGPQVQDSGDQRARRCHADPGKRPPAAFFADLHGVRLRLPERFRKRRGCRLRTSSSRCTAVRRRDFSARWAPWLRRRVPTVRPHYRRSGRLGAARPFHPASRGTSWIMPS